MSLITTAAEPKKRGGVSVQVWLSDGWRGTDLTCSQCEAPLDQLLFIINRWQQHITDENYPVWWWLHFLQYMTGLSTMSKLSYIDAKIKLNMNVLWLFASCKGFLMQTNKSLSQLCDNALFKIISVVNDEDYFFVIIINKCNKLCLGETSWSKLHKRQDKMRAMTFWWCRQPVWYKFIAYIKDRTDKSGNNELVINSIWSHYVLRTYKHS